MTFCRRSTGQSRTSDDRRPAATRRGCSGTPAQGSEAALTAWFGRSDRGRSSRELVAAPASALGRRIDELLNYALELTGQASMLAFRPHDGHWDALAAGFGDGLGPAADELRRLAEAVTGRVTDGGGDRPVAQS
jgi:hypothetical protein